MRSTSSRLPAKNEGKDMGEVYQIRRQEDQSAREQDRPDGKNPSFLI
jgi:hypothetical protein